MSEVHHAGGAKNKAIVALLTAVPFGIAAAVILGNAYHSKASNEKKWHIAAPLAFAACALFALAFLLECALLFKLETNTSFDTALLSATALVLYLSQ